MRWGLPVLQEESRNSTTWHQLFKKDLCNAHAVFFNPRIRFAWQGKVRAYARICVDEGFPSSQECKTQRDLSNWLERRDMPKKPEVRLLLVRCSDKRKSRYNVQCYTIFEMPENKRTSTGRFAAPWIISKTMEWVLPQLEEIYLLQHFKRRKCVRPHEEKWVDYSKKIPSSSWKSEEIISD